MKATGIVRRIDDLGRIVIPKEIRRSLNIREGDPLELFTMDGGVCFKKYSFISENQIFFDKLYKGLTDNDNFIVAITDTDRIISGKERYLGTNLSKALSDEICKEKYKYTDENQVVENIPLTDDEYNKFFVKKIYRISPTIGAIILFNRGTDGISVPIELDMEIKYIKKTIKRELEE